LLYEEESALGPHHVTHSSGKERIVRILDFFSGVSPTILVIVMLMLLMIAATIYYAIACRTNLKAVWSGSFVIAQVILLVLFWADLFREEPGLWLIQLPTWSVFAPLVINLLIWCILPYKKEYEEVRAERPVKLELVETPLRHHRHAPGKPRRRRAS